MKKVLFGFAYLFFSMAIAVAISEAIIRLFIPSYEYLPHPKGLYSGDPILGYINTPNYRGTIEKRDYAARIYTNSLGMRTDSLMEIPDSEDFNILLLGDSFTYAGQVPFQETFAFVLEKHLRQLYPARRIRVWNAGVNGYGTIHEFSSLKKIFDEVNPAIVILQFFNNDIQDNYIYAATHNIAYRTVKNGYLYTVEEAGVTFALPQPLRDFLHFHCHLYLYFKQRLSLYLNRYRIDSELGIFAKHEPDFISKGWNETQMILRDFRTFCESKGTSYILFSIPDMLQFNKGYLETFNIDLNLYDLKKPSSRISELAEIERIPFMDMMPLLEAAGDPVSFYLQYTYDRHFNEKGHRFTAQQLAAYISQKKIIP